MRGMEAVEGCKGKNIAIAIAPITKGRFNLETAFNDIGWQ